MQYRPIRAERRQGRGDPLLTQHAPVPAARILIDFDRVRLVAEVDATLVPLVEQLLDE
jgi:hypothetical protein